MLDRDAVWFVTGCSRGLGRAIAQQALRSGYRVAVTARRPDEVADIVAAHGNAGLGLQLDVADPAQIAEAVRRAERHFGQVDVLVNNAGYGYMGAVEEGEDEGVRAMFETNVFGPVNLIKALLPGMRGRRRGHIVNISSVGGMVTFPAVGYYHMAKFAIEGLSETLAKELAPFGIGCMVVEPGAFLTDFREQTPAKEPATRIPAYAETAGRARDGVFAAHRKQQGDPDRGASAIVSALEAEKPPVHLVLGGDALDLIRSKIADLGHELDAWEAVSRSTNLPVQASA